MVEDPDDDFFLEERFELIRNVVGSSARESYWSALRVRVSLCPEQDLITGYYAGINPNPNDVNAYISQWDAFE